MPELDVSKLNMCNSRSWHLRKKDLYITPKIVADFQRAMKKVGKKLTVQSYDADHGFANPSNPNHDPVATADAMERTQKFLNKAFGRK
jgi:carboxymethylenebutenolidase